MRLPHCTTGEWDSVGEIRQLLLHTAVLVRNN